LADRQPIKGWRWAWARDVRELVLALDADAAGQQQWRALARQGALLGGAEDDMVRVSH